MYLLFLSLSLSLSLFKERNQIGIYPLTLQAEITETDYRAIIDGLEDDVDLEAADNDEEAGLLSVFQVG
jgi:hypothetical protein